MQTEVSVKTVSTSPVTHTSDRPPPPPSPFAPSPQPPPVLTISLPSAQTPFAVVPVCHKASSVLPSHSPPPPPSTAPPPIVLCTVRYRSTIITYSLLPTLTPAPLPTHPTKVYCGTFIVLYSGSFPFAFVSCTLSFPSAFSLLLTPPPPLTQRFLFILFLSYCTPPPLILSLPPLSIPGSSTLSSAVPLSSFLFSTFRFFL